jgi:hypothetical protein
VRYATTERTLLGDVRKNCAHASTRWRAQPAAKECVKLAPLLPNAADLYRKQSNLGLDGDPRRALKARAMLTKLIGPVVIEERDDGSVWARYDFRPAALLAEARAVGVGGRGEGIWPVPTLPQRVRLK